jgi:hypothetical protein
VAPKKKLARKRKASNGASKAPRDIARQIEIAERELLVAEREYVITQLERSEAKDVSRALARAIRSTMDNGAIGGNPLSGDVLSILVAVQAAVQGGDVGALNAKHGPVKWARAYLKHLNQGELVLSRAETARAFVGWIHGQVGDRGAGRFIDGELARELAEYASAWLNIVACAPQLVPRSAVPDVDRMTREIRRAAARDDANAKTIAVALLKGCGCSAAYARDALWAL